MREHKDRLVQATGTATMNTLHVQNTAFHLFLQRACGIVGRFGGVLSQGAWPMNHMPARLASKPPSPAMSDLERQQTDAALLTLARVLATIAAARTKAARTGGTHAA